MRLSQLKCQAQGLAFAQQMLLADDIIQGAGAEAFSQWRGAHFYGNQKFNQ
jgi:hypothetical protein